MICTLTASEDLDSKLVQKKEACEKERKQTSELKKNSKCHFYIDWKTITFAFLKLELPLVKKRQKRRIRGKYMRGTPGDPGAPNTELTFVQKLNTKICSSCFYGHFFLPIQLQKFNVVQDNI